MIEATLHSPPPGIPDHDPNTNTESPHDSHILGRLSTMFNQRTSLSPGTHLSSDHDSLLRCKTIPTPGTHGSRPGVLSDIETGTLSPRTFVDRPAIKVLIVTWNMGDAVVSVCCLSSLSFVVLAIVTLGLTAAQRRPVSTVWRRAAL